MTEARRVRGRMPAWFKRWVEAWLEPQFDRIATLTTIPTTAGPPSTGRFTFHRPEGDPHMADFTVTDAAKPGTGAVSYLDAAGQPADLSQFAAPPAWSVDDPSIFVLTPAADGLTCGIALASPAKLGVGTITIDAKDKDGTDVKIVAVGQVVAGEATAGSFAFTPGA